MTNPENATETSQGSVGTDQLRSGNGESMTDKVVADRYLVLGVLGSGAMGTVYRARHQLLNREVALKVLRKDAAEDETSRKRFENEARAAASLTHSNLIAVTDYGFTNTGTPFLVMDCIQGQSLSAVLKQYRVLSDEQFLNIMTQICAGLAHAHEKGLIHRDLKPSNILLTRGDSDEELVKIVDFGLAKPIVGDQDLTHTGQIFGTPLYMSPEQCQGRKLDARSDLYALGCLMYRMVAGKLPFTGDNPVTTIVMHVKDAPPVIPDDKLNSSFKKALVPIIMKALAKDPVERHQTAAELRTDLVKAACASSQPLEVLHPSDTTLTELEAVGIEDEVQNRARVKTLILSSIGCFILAAAIVAAVTTTMLQNHETNQQANAEHRAAVIAAGQSSVSPVSASTPICTIAEMPKPAPPIQSITKPKAAEAKPKVRPARNRALRHAPRTRKKPGLIRSLLNGLLN